MPPKPRDHTGQSFGKLTVLSYSHSTGARHMYFCRCECGKEILVGGTHLRSGHTRSCGCLQKETNGDATRLHPLFREANPRWKGGVRMKDGYVTLLMPEHPNANKNGYVKRATLVMTGLLGRPLVKGELVHHVNDVKADDSPQNLKLTGRPQHTSHHHKGLIKPNSLKNLRPRQSSHLIRP